MCLNQTKPQINLVIIKMEKKKIIICQILEKNSLCKNIVKEKQQQLEKTKTELIKKTQLLAPFVTIQINELLMRYC